MRYAITASLTFILFDPSATAQTVAPTAINASGSATMAFPGGSSGAIAGGTMGPGVGIAFPGGGSGAVGGGTMGPGVGVVVPSPPAVNSLVTVPYVTTFAPGTQTGSYGGAGLVVTPSAAPGSFVPFVPSVAAPYAGTSYGAAAGGVNGSIVAGTPDVFQLGPGRPPSTYGTPGGFVLPVPGSDPIGTLRNPGAR
jgi:hypothetical protein